MVSDHGTLNLNLIPNPWPTHPLVTVCISLEVLTIALVKSLFGVNLLCWRHTSLSLSSFRTAFLGSFSPTVILYVISLSILTFFLFIQVGKPVLDRLHQAHMYPPVKTIPEITQAYCINLSTTETHMAPPVVLQPTFNDMPITPIIPTDPLFPSCHWPTRPFHLGEDITVVGRGTWFVRVEARDHDGSPAEWTTQELSSWQKLINV